MPETANPYIAGSPVTGPEMFFGRDDVFNFVRQALTGQHRDHVLVLYGQRRTGKTSVLYQMSRRLGERYVCIFVDLHGLALNGLGGFLWELANHITRVLRREFQVSLPALDRAAFQDDPRSAFEHTFLDSVWGQIGSRHLLLMLDEAVRLEEQVRDGKMEMQVFNYLRHLMQHHPRLNFLFSLGSGLEEMQKEYAFLFNVALYKKISFLDRASAKRLITEPARETCPFQDEAVDRIFEITSGHPYFTQLVCHSLFNRCLGEAGVTRDDVDAVLDETVERGLAVLKHIWEESTPGEKAVLAALASTGQGSGAGQAGIIQVWVERGVTLPESEAARAARSLVARDVITGEDSYAFTVDLMRLWVQKFRRLDWVKEEIEDSARQWTLQQETQRALLRDTRRAEEQEVRVQRQPANNGQVQIGRPNLVLSSSVLLIVGLLGLFALITFGIFAITGNWWFLPRASTPEPLLNPVVLTRVANSPPGRGEAAADTTVKRPSLILGGPAAQVTSMVVLGGYVWAGTEGGLVRWSADGSYELFPGSDLGFWDDCAAILAARHTDSTLWLGCGGVATVRVEGDSLARLGYYNRDDGLDTGVVRALAIDPDGNVWAGGLRDEGELPPLNVLLRDNPDHDWTNIETFLNPDLSASWESLGGTGAPLELNVTSIAFLAKDRVILGLIEDGILYLEKDSVRLFQENDGVGLPGLEDRRIRSLWIDGNGQVWAAASEQGLLQFNEEQNRWDIVALGDLPEDTPIRSVTGFRDGSLWVGGDYLVMRSIDGGQTWTQVGTGEGLGDDIGGLVMDDAGRVWAGSYGGGVSVWDGSTWLALQQ